MKEKILKKYNLKQEITNDTLKENGFHYGKYKKDIYNGLIYLIIFVDLNGDEDGAPWWNYQICNADMNTLYAPYYNRTIGKNDVVKKLDKTINKIFEDMNNVFEKKNKRGVKH